MSLKGVIYPSESRWHVDARTQARIRQVTDHPSIHHHPFFFVQPYDVGMNWLVFASHRTSTPQLFAEVRSTGQLLQLTDRPDLAEWSFHPSPDGRYVYFVAGQGAWQLDLQTLAERELANFGSAEMRETGMVGNAMGTTTLSQCGQWWAIPVKAGGVSRFYVINTATGSSQMILERDTIGHPQFCPDDSNLIFYAGPLTHRLWLINRDGSNNRHFFPRENDQQWFTHESWIRGRKELAFVDWPNGVRAVNADTGHPRWVTRFPAWHAHTDDSGQFFVCDTNFPDQGLHSFGALEGGAPPRQLCMPQASSIGAHWAHPFPYNNGPVKVHAPQHTHPHPRVSPDGSRILYTSDVSGHAQLYELML